MISRPSGPDAAMTAHVFVVPMSRPAIVSPLAIRPRLHLYHDILCFDLGSPTTSSTWTPPIPSTDPAENYLNSTVGVPGDRRSIARTGRFVPIPARTGATKLAFLAK